MTGKMKIKLYFLLFIIISNLLYSQKKTKKSTESFFSCYLPTGYKCSEEVSKLKTMAEINLHFEPKGRTWFALASKEDDGEIPMVIFKSFTKTPLYLLLSKNKNYSKEKIDEIINSINEDNSSYIYYMSINKYGHHWGIKSDVKKFIERNILDKDFLIETLGNPDEIKESIFGGNPATCFTYNNVGIRIYFKNNLGIGYEEFD